MKLLVLEVIVLLSVCATSMCNTAGHISSASNVRIIAFKDGVALWRENRKVELVKGVNQLEFSEVPLTIDNPSIIVRSLTEQENFKLLETGVSTPSKTTGLPAVEGTPPTNKEHIESSAKLFASVLTSKSGRHECELLYKVSELQVTPRYVALLGPKGTMDLKGLVSINNGCGLAISGAAVYLPVEATSPPEAMTRRSPYSSQHPPSRTKTVIHSALNLISTPVSVEKGQTKNFEFVSLLQVPFGKTNLYDGLPMNVSITPILGDYDSSRRSRSYSIQRANAHVVKIIYELETSTFHTPKSGLPLAGVQVYQLGTDRFIFEQGYLEFDRRHERYKITTGPHPGLVGSRKQIAFKEVASGQSCEETIEVSIRNDTAKTQEVWIREYLVRSEKYKIQKNNQEYKEIKPGLIEFKIAVKPGKSSSIEYTVKYEY